MNEFLGRLRERKLVQWALAYVAAAFALLQGIDIVAQRFGWPEQTMRLVIIALSVGLFVTLVLAWYHGERGAQRVSGTELLILALLLALGGGFLWRFAGASHERVVRSDASPDAAGAPTRAPVAIPEKSIAVLPFANLSRDPDNAFFADGIQDEILTRLSKIADLKVISRTSTLKYQGAPSNLREIGQQLEVANILEGSVQKSGGQVRVTVQLIKALNDSHLWADTYDRNLVDVFQVESDVAQKIAASLEATLTGGEKRAIELVGTKNPEAYEAYLRARALQNKQSLEDRQRLIEYCRRAVELDPNFVQAWADLAIAESEMYFGDIHTKERFERARTAAETALRLGPDQPEAHRAIGFFYYYTLQDFDRALKELKFAQERLPNNAANLESIALVHRRQGKLEESIKGMEQSAQLDPRNEDIWVNLGRTYRGMRSFAKAREMFDRGLALAPGEKSIIGQKAEVYLAEGDLDGMSATVRGVAFGANEGTVLRLAAMFYRRQFDEVLQTVNSGLADEKNLPPLIVVFLHAAIADVHLAKGEKTLAQPLYEQAEREFQDLRAKGDESLDLADALIQGEARLGRREEVQRQAEALIARTSKDRWRYPRTEEILARAYVALGDFDRAFPLLEQALAANGEISFTAAILRLDPAFDPIRGDPRYGKLLTPKSP